MSASQNLPDGLPFFAPVTSLAVSPAWFEDIGRLAAAHRTLPILLHHQGLVRAVDGIDSADLRGLVALAEHPNVGVKVSGFYYGSRDKAEYPYEDQIQVFERIYRAFGARRLTWGSDYPVSPWVACTYAQTLDVVRRHCPFVSEADLALILGDTAAGLLETRRLPAG